jgi:hypothetical protein
MAESPTILASLDRFIEAFKTERGVEIGRRVATGKHRVAIIKAAENQGFGQFGHCGHSELDSVLMMSMTPTSGTLPMS